MGFPQPEAGLVISYSYLWSDEAEPGQVEGRKDRPCATVLVVVQRQGQAPLVTVAPSTHSPQRDPGAAIEIPLAVKRYLGIGRSTVVDRTRRFQRLHMAGIRPTAHPGQKDRYHYGFLPPKLFESIIAKFSELRRQGQAARTSRDDETSPSANRPTDRDREGVCQRIFAIPNAKLQLTSIARLGR